MTTTTATTIRGAPRARLPAELADMVLDHLADAPAALRATARVCRAWLPRSRVHLFRRVCPPPRAARDGFGGLHAFLARTPHVRAYVRHLVLAGPERYGADEAEDDGEVDVDTDDKGTERAPAVLPPHVLAALLALLPRLRTLQLHNLSFRSPHPWPLRCPPHKTTLDRLTLMHVGAPSDSAADVLRVLALFGSVGFLHLAGVSHAPADAARLGGALPRVCVRGVRLEDAQADLYCAVVRGAEEGVKCVEVECSSVEDAVAVAGLVARERAGVEQLAVDLTQCFRADDDAEDSEPYIPGTPRISAPRAQKRTHSALDPRTIADILGGSIVACPALRALDVALALDAPCAARPHAAWACLLGLLAAAPPALAELTLQLAADGDAAPRALAPDWAPLCDALRRFEGLREVRVVSAPASEWQMGPGEREAVARALGAWAEKGVLHVGY